MKQAIRKTAILFYHAITSEHVGRASAAASYYALFMIFPLIISISALASTFHYTDTAIAKLELILPEQIQDSIISYFEYVSGSNSLRFIITGFLMFFFFCFRLVDFIQYNLTEIYSPDHTQSFFRRFLRSLSTTIVLIALIPFLFLTIFLSKNIIIMVWDSFSLPLAAMDIWYILRFPLAIICMLLLVTMFYRFATYHILSFRDVFSGAVIAFVLWLFTTLLFTFYLNHIGDYSVLYGAMGTVIALMLWCYFTMYSLFLGAKINFEIRNN